MGVVESAFWPPLWGEPLPLDLLNFPLVQLEHKEEEDPSLQVEQGEPAVLPASEGYGLTSRTLTPKKKGTRFQPWGKG